MNPQHFQTRHLQHQVLFEFALLENELEAVGKTVPRLALKEPSALLRHIRQLRAQIKPPAGGLST